MGVMRVVQEVFACHSERVYDSTPVTLSRQRRISCPALHEQRVGPREMRCDENSAKGLGAAWRFFVVLEPVSKLALVRIAHEQECVG